MQNEQLQTLCTLFWDQLNGGKYKYIVSFFTMEDQESKTDLVSDEPMSHAPLTFCSLVFRLKRDRLALRELVKFAAAIMCVQLICATGILFMRPPVANVTLGRYFVVLSMVPICILYIFVYANIVTGPWGSEKSRFWCDIRIMYARGFNTIRTVLNMFSNTLLLMFLGTLLGNDGALSLAFIFLLSILSEWKFGIAENTNQYEIKAYDKFMDGDFLCVETLHCYQMQHRREKVLWSSFLCSMIIKFYTVTAMLCTADTTRQGFVFKIPIAISIVTYTCILPSVLSFMYFKDIGTFSHLELYRTIIDVFFPILIVSFSLV